MGANNAWGGAIFDPRGMVGRIYKEDYYTLPHTKHESSRPCGFGEEDFLCFTHAAPRAGPVWTQGARLAGFIKRTIIHCYTQNIKALGLLVSEKKIFLCFSYDAPGVGPVWTPGARLAGFMKRTTIHCYTQNMKALGLVVSEKKIFLCFSHCMSMGANDPPGAGPFLTPGAWLAGFIKRTTTHCYIQNMKALGIVVWEKKIFYVFPMTPLGQGPYEPQGHCWQDL